MARKQGYQYETSPRKLEPRPVKKTTKQPKKQTVNQSEKQAKKQPSKQQQEKLKQKKFETKAIFYLLIVFAILFAIGYRNTQIDESFVKVENLKKELALVQKENQQLKIKIENGLNLETIEHLAKTQLGMQKLDSSQKVYISLPKKDYIEPASEKVLMQEETWFDKIIQMIKNIL